MKNRPRLLIVCNVDWFFISHRLGIGKRAVEVGYDVYVAAEDTGRSAEISSQGMVFINLQFSRSGTNPLTELTVLRRFYSLYKHVRPDIVHHVTIKPVIYGSLVAKRLKINGVVNAIAGLGYNFTAERKGLFLSILIKLLRYGFSRSNLAVIFQNQTDYQDLKAARVLNEDLNKVFFTKGSGVDLNLFDYSEPQDKDRVIVLFPTRMLWDKGVRELKEATEILKGKYESKVTFLLVGLADDGNRGGVSSSYLNEWSDGSYVKWVGYQKSMVGIYKQSDIVVLPSYYREGMPKSLIEACAIGRPIVTTDWIGCRDCVDNEVNGYKILPKDSTALATAIEKLISNKILRAEMGRNSREKAEREFDVEVVISTHLQIYKESLDYSPRP